MRSVFSLLNNSVFKVIKNRLDTYSNDFLAVTLKLRERLPNFMPSKSNTIVYTSVREAQSATKLDVYKYLNELKLDLQVSCENTPLIVLCGDQQTYSILRDNDKAQFGWFCPYPGDWHMLKLISEIIRDLLWDGGLKQFCIKCGIESDLTQWQDIHIMLLTCYESLLEFSVAKFQSLPENSTRDYWEWVHSVHSENNKNEIGRFWAQILVTLHFYTGFYISIRSGNWVMRNTFLKALAPLFFSYGKTKYQVLFIRNTYDTFTLPLPILSKFMDGEWTVSLKGLPFSNLAVDEAHESVINRRMKAITSRPSAFRTVELADFMSYLDTILVGFECYVLQNNSTPKQHYKMYVSQRVPIVRQLLFDNNVDLFSINLNETVPLRNIFVSNPPSLDYQTRKDLLTFDILGKERLVSRVEIFLNATDKRKISAPKLKTFTVKLSTRRQMKNREKSLSTILSNAFRLIQSGPNVVQTSPYPLALCDINGIMRPSHKSSFRDALSSNAALTEMFKDTLNFNFFPNAPIALYVDFLYFMHMPPPFTVVKYHELASHLWKLAVTKFLGNNNVREVYIVIDKPDFLPPPRNIVHELRSANVNTHTNTLSKLSITDDDDVLHGSHYASFISDKGYKSLLVEYLCKKFLEISLKYNIPLFVIDSQAIHSAVRLQKVISMPLNEHGEADYAIWYHVARSTVQNSLVVSKDTDAWVYGLALMEQGYLEGKHVVVKRGNSEEYVDLNVGFVSLKSLPCLRSITHPVTSIVALYVLTGCDYVSSFYRVTKKQFLNVFFEHASYLSSHSANKSLVCISRDKFETVDIDSFIHLCCTAYLLKQNNVMNGVPLELFHLS